MGDGLRDEEMRLQQRRTEFIRRMARAVGADQPEGDVYDAALEVLRDIEISWFWCGRRGALLDMAEQANHLLK